MDVQNDQVSCARHPETKCLLENVIMLEKKNKVKTQFGDVFLDEIHRKGKLFAEQPAGKCLLIPAWC